MQQKPNAMREKPIGRASTTKRRGTDWERLRGLRDGDIQSAVKEDSDASPTDVEFWRQARVVLPQAK